MYFSWSNLLIGIIGVALGVWIVKESFYLNHHILFLGWVERKWGPGMGTTAYKLIGLVLCVFSLFVAFGQINLFESPYDSAANGSRTTTQVLQAPTTGSNIAP